ncbi:MAG: F0F1 ATP synthase subunit delta [Candidatus Gracilibacteria bacterium]|jgi:F-type H+-transporting ATPase subunit delta
MKISVKKYAEALTASLYGEKDRGVANEKIQNLLSLLQRKKKGKLIRRLPEVFRKIWQERNKQMEVKATFSKEPSKNEVTEFAESLSKTFDKEVVVNVAVDEAIIGGVKLEFGEYVVEGTVVKNLEILKNKLVSSNK